MTDPNNEQATQAAAPIQPMTQPATQPAPEPAGRRLKRPARIALWSVGTLAALALLGTVLIGQWLPGFLKPRLEAAASDALGAPVAIGRIDLQPWQAVVQVDGLRIGTAEAPLFTLASVQTQLAVWPSLRLRAPVIARLKLSEPVLTVQRLAAEGAGAGGPDRFNFSPIVDHLRERAAKAPPAPPSDGPARFALHNLQLEGGAVHYSDPARQIEHHLDALRLALPLLSSLPSDVATEVQPLLEARIDGSAFKLDGHAKPFTETRPAELALSWQGVKLADWASLLRALLPPDLAPQTLDGTLATELALSFETRPAPQPPELRVRGQLTLADVDVAVSGQGLRTGWKALQVEGIDVSPLEARHAIGRVALDGLRLALTRAPAGDGEKAAKPAAAPAPAPAASATASAASDAAAPAAAPLRWRLGEFACTGCELHLRDDSTTPPVQVDATELSLSLKNLAGPATEPLLFELATRLHAHRIRPEAVRLADNRANRLTTAPPGRIKLSGSAAGLLPAAEAQALAVRADVSVEALDLRAVQPYLEPFLNLTLVDVQVGTTGQLSVDAPAGAGFAPETLRVAYRGGASLSGLNTQDSVTGADFLRWKRLALDGLDARWAGGKDGGTVDADLGRIALDGLQARVILHPDAHLNLADLVKRERGAAPQSLTTPQPVPAAPAAPKPAPVDPANAPVKVKWQGIALRDGSVFFTDNFIKPNYSARLTQLKGELSALSSTAPEPARLSLTGALDDGAPLRIAGRVHPLGARVFTDIEASARGIALTRMSTYAERYAGYAIEKGSLSVTVRYKIENGQLEAENQVFLDQLTFGDKVDSPDATSLPVRLAVALLKDSRGVIDIRLPISGTLDDPQFSVGGLIWKVLGNLIVKAVTAPFAMLFGGDSNEASHLAFAPGSAELDDAGRERLDALAQRLIDKPALKIEATGRADPVADAAAIQAAHAAALAPAAAASGVVAAASAPRSAASAPARAAVAASAPARAAVGASAPASAASAAPPQLDPAALNRALRELADARGDKVLAYLAAKLPAERVLLNRSQVTSDRPDGDSGPASRVQFELR